MSYSNSFPQQRPTLNLDFANSGKLDSRLSYTRSSGGTYLSNGKGLNSENLLRYSNPNNALWVESKNATITTNSVAAPNGSTTASKITEDNTAGVQHRTYISQTVASGETFTYVGYLKANGRTIVQLSTTGAGASAGVEFNLSGSGTATTRSGSPSNAAITQIGTDWYKCSFQVSSTSSALLYTQIVMCDAANSTVYNGDGTSGVYAWGFNLSTTGQLVTDATSGQIHREYSPLLKTAAADAPRFEYATDGQSAAGSPLGLLIESQSTNYNTKSEDIAGWSTPSNMTVSASAMVAPNGTLTADVLTVSDDTVASGHFAYRASSDGTSGQTVAASFFAKTAGVNHIYFYDANTANAGADSVSIFDLNNGTIGGTNAPNCKMIDCGNGWWRCVSVYTLTGAGTGLRFYTTDNGSTTTYIGNGFDGFGLWGVQVEIGVSSESSYISTSGSTVSRASDSCSVATSSFYTGGDVSIVSETIGGSGNFAGCWVIKNSTGSEALQLYKQSAAATEATDFHVYANSGGTNTVNTLITSSASAGKIAVSYGSNDVAFTASGNAVQTDTSSSSIGAVDTLIIGGITTTNQLNGHIKRLSLYSVALSDLELQSLTSNP